MQPSIGDYLTLTCLNATTNTNYNRTVKLGFRSFIGCTWEEYNATSIIITQVYTTDEGGNNEGIIQPGLVITKVDNMSINYNNSMTLDYFLTLQQPDYSINLTGNDSKVYQLAVNFYPTIGGAFYFNNFYAGISYEEISPSLIQITEIYSNGSNNGINKGRIPVGALITKINGIQLNLVNTSVKDFVSQNVPVTPGDQIILTDSNNINYTLNTTPIPVISVFIGLTSQDYWLSGGNILGEILGPTFQISYQPNYNGHGY